MPAFRLTAKARADVVDIGRYTQRTWGRDQRNRYLAQLDEAFHLLAREPGRGRPCDEIRQGDRKYSVGRHVIFDRQASPDIEIIRILQSVWTLTPACPSETRLQRAIDAGRASGPSDRAMDELITDAEQDAAANSPAGHA